MDKEMYLGDRHRVVRSIEEQALFGAAGWKDQRDPNVKQYRPYTAVDAKESDAPADDPKPDAGQIESTESTEPTDVKPAKPKAKGTKK